MLTQIHHDQVVRLYDTVFDRAPDPEGLAFWTAHMDSGWSLHRVAGLFITAEEFALTYGQPDNRAFVEEMYRNVLDREGEPLGVAGWTGWLDSGAMDRASVVAGFSESQEHILQMEEAAEPAPAQPPTPVVLYGGDGADAFRGGEGNDMLVGWLGADTLSAGAGDDVLWGGRDTTIDRDAWAGLLNDSGDAIYGGAGNDRLHGDGGADKLHGDDGNDVLEGLWGDDLLMGGDGDDALWGDAVAVQAARLLTNAADVLGGGAGADYLNGGGGDDRLHGDDGDDVLDGWSGADEMTGGAGADRFLLGAGINGGLTMGSGRDSITDFEQGDVIDLSRVMPDEAFTFIGQEPFSGSGRAEVRFSETADGVLVQIDAPSTYGGGGPLPAGQPDAEVSLPGVRTLNAPDFIL